MVKKLLLVVLGLVIGLTVGVGYGRIGSQNCERGCQQKIKESNRRLSQMQRHLTEEKDQERLTFEGQRSDLATQVEALEKQKKRHMAEMNELKTDIEATETKRAALEKRAASAEAKVPPLEEKNTQLTERLAKMEADRNSLNQKQRQTLVTLQDREKELAQLSADWKRLNERYDQCAEANAQLYQVGEELIARFEGKSTMSKLLEKEPFTQIKRVEIERLAQDYKNKIDQQKIRTK